jgi:hypothetical protein
MTFSELLNYIIGIVIGIIIGALIGVSTKSFSANNWLIYGGMAIVSGVVCGLLSGMLFDNWNIGGLSAFVGFVAFIVSIVVYNP